jgi:ubiquitin-conjugating enzyme E2 variant
MAQLLIGWLIADFLSGVVHWVEDRLLWVGMPLISKAIVEPNRLHHVDPQAFLSSSLFSRNSTTWASAIAVALAWLMIAGFSWIWLGAIAGGLAVTEVHAHSHRPTARAGWYRALQEIGIVQSAPHHWGHHAGGMDTRYCILTGWLNPLLDRLRLWARLESGIEMIGLKPNRGTA